MLLLSWLLLEKNQLAQGPNFLKYIQKFIILEFILGPRLRINNQVKRAIKKIYLSVELPLEFLKNGIIGSINDPTLG